MRLEIFSEKVTTLALPWDDAVSSWQSGRAGSGEIARFIDAPNLAICELKGQNGHDRVALLQTMSSYGLPVLEPIALAQERHQGGDLLIMAWDLSAQTLEQTLMDPSQDREALAQAIARILVHLHLAGIEGQGQWSLAFMGEGEDFAAYFVGLQGSLRTSMTQEMRRASLKSLERYLKQVAGQTNFSVGESVAFATAVTREYGELWHRIEATRLFDQDDTIQLTANVTTMDHLNDRQRTLVLNAEGGIAMSVRYRFICQDHHKMLLHMLTGIHTEQEAGRQILRDIARYRSWLEFSSGRPWPRALAANRWVNDVYAPAMQALPPLPQLSPSV